MFFNRCPNREELERFAVQADAPRVGKHLLKCDACRQIVEQIGQDRDTLAELRQALSEALDDRSRGRILDICLRVAGEERRVRPPEGGPSGGSAQ